MTLEPPPTYTSISTIFWTALVVELLQRLRGTNFTGAISVTIDGIEVTDFVVNSSTINHGHHSSRCFSSAKNVVVTTPGGTATGPSAFTYLQAVTFNANGGSGSMPIQTGSSHRSIDRKFIYMDWLNIF